MKAVPIMYESRITPSGRIYFDGHRLSNGFLYINRRARKIGEGRYPAYQLFHSERNGWRVRRYDSYNGPVDSLSTPEEVVAFLDKTYAGEYWEVRQRIERQEREAFEAAQRALEEGRAAARQRILDSGVVTAEELEDLFRVEREKGHEDGYQEGYDNGVENESYRTYYD